MSFRPSYAACFVLPLFAGCSAPPPLLARVPVQDAEAILQTLQPLPKPKRTALAELGLVPKPSPAWLVRPDAGPSVSGVVHDAPPPPPIPAPTAAQQVPAPDVELRALIDAWRASWERGDAAGYIGFYAPGFKGDAPSRAEWEKQRATRLANGRIQVGVKALEVALVGSSEAQVRFRQDYRSGRHRDVGVKHLRLKREGAAWKIVEERWSPV